MEAFWDAFYERPVDEIPWNKVQADYFIELVESGVVKGRSALDMGCGAGRKSVFLAEHGFVDVVGIDIAAKAIAHAKANAEVAGVAGQCTFYEHDITDLSFLPGDKQFDLVLDWATMHCLPAEKRAAYAASLVERLKDGGQLLLRVFSANDGRHSFVEHVDDLSETVSVLSEKEVLELFPTLHVVNKNTSQPHSKHDLHFLEILFQKPASS